MDQREPDAGTRKKPYTKPAVVKVTLLPEEAVLATCKTDRSKGPATGKCDKPFACQTIGS